MGSGGRESAEVAALHFPHGEPRPPRSSRKGLRTQACGNGPWLICFPPTRQSPSSPRSEGSCPGKSTSAHQNQGPLSPDPGLAPGKELSPLTSALSTLGSAGYGEGRNHPADQTPRAFLGLPSPYPALPSEACPNGRRWYHPMTSFFGLMSLQTRKRGSKSPGKMPLALRKKKWEQKGSPSSVFSTQSLAPPKRTLFLCPRPWWLYNSTGCHCYITLLGQPNLCPSPPPLHFRPKTGTKREDVLSGPIQSHAWPKPKQKLEHPEAGLP